MNVLLINPPTIGRLRQSQSIVLPPIGLLYIATVLEQHNINVVLIDALGKNLSLDDLEHEIETCAPDIVGITGMTPIIKRSYKVAEISKKYAKYVVLGGPHATIYKQEIFNACQAIDIGVYGEGENSFIELIKSIQKNKPIENISGIFTRDVLGPPRELIEDLNTLPIVNRDLVKDIHYKHFFTNNREVATIFSSRGCPYQCIFCDKSVFGSKWRSRNAQNIYQEVIKIKEGYKISDIIFYDDLFTTDKKRVVEFCNLLINNRIRVNWKCEGRVNIVDSEVLRLMKKAGCSMIAYGVESGNQKSLDFLNKNVKIQQIEQAFRLTREAGIKTIGYFLLGIPNESYKNCLNTIRFAQKIKTDYAQFSILSPIVNTKLYDISIQEGWYKELPIKNPMELDDKRPILISGDWNEETLEKILKKAYLSFYLRPRTILQCLLKPVNLKNYFMQFLSLCKWYLTPSR